MTTNPLDDGATKIPGELDRRQNECMQRWAHRWQWVWVGSTWTNRQRCSTCGEERVADRKGQEN